MATYWGSTFWLSDQSELPLLLTLLFQFYSYYLVYVLNILATNYQVCLDAKLNFNKKTVDKKLSL